MKFDFDTASRDLAATIDADKGPEEMMNLLCKEIGPRPPGSSSIRHAREAISALWSGFGVERIHQEDLSLAAWDSGKSVVQVLSPTNRFYESASCINSSGGIMQGTLIDARDLDFTSLYKLRERVHDSILLVNSFEFTGGRCEVLQKKVSLAEAAGATAVVFIGQHPELPATFFINRSRIPAVNISAKAGAELRELCDRGSVLVKLQTSGIRSKVTCANLVGELGPNSTATEMIITCAHLDSVPSSQGALDNISGIVVMTQIAGALAAYKSSFLRTLRLIAFTGEEYGYMGSSSYIREHMDELDHVGLVLSLDCLYENTARGLAVMWSPEVKDYIAEALASRHPEVNVRNHFCMSSDYLPFMLAGVPAARPADWHRSFPLWTHTTADTLEKVPITSLKSNAIVCARILLKMLMDPSPLPSRRNTPEEIEKLIDRDGARESLRWQIGLY